MTLSQIRNAVDAKLVAVWPSVVAHQAAYFAAHGRYWQGLASTSILPQDGVETAPDRLNDAPAYQGFAWAQAFPSLPATLPMCIWIDQYVTPELVCGYEAHVAVRVLGVRYERSQNVGPETWRTTPWHVAEEE